MTGMVLGTTQRFWVYYLEFSILAQIFEMKKGIFSIVILFVSSIIFPGCIKTSPTVFTINPSMTANIGTYNFIASSTVPSTLDTAVYDSTTTLIITGYSSDPVYPYDKIVLSITKYKGVTNTFSIVQEQASATYYHSTTVSSAAGGVVSITKVTANSVIGYFSFNTNDNIAVTNGAFNVGKP